MKENVRKPDGGYCFVPAMAIARAWWAYKAGILGRVELQVWFACYEAVARRCGLQKGRVPRYSIQEIQKLTGRAGGRTVREAISRLEKSGLLSWSESALKVCDGSAVEKLDTHGELCRMADLIVNHRRKVPVPRRVLRFLAAGTREVVTATVLGHLLRCVYYRKKGIRSDGLVKASWIADLFGIHERNVKAARKQLSHCGLIRLGTANQFVLNRFGLPTEFNVHWRDATIVQREKTVVCPPPQSPAKCDKPPPPRKTENSLSRFQHQELGVPNPNGVRKRTGKATTFPTLTTADLRSGKSLLAFHDFAVALGWCKPSEADRLLVFSAAAHALRVGTQNVPGLFVSTLKRTNRQYISQEDEDWGIEHMRRVRELAFKSVETWTDRVGVSIGPCGVY